LDDILAQGQQNQDTAKRSIDAYINFVSKFQATTRNELNELLVIYNILCLSGKDNPTIFKLMISPREHGFILKLKERICDLDKHICDLDEHICDLDKGIFDDQFFDYLLNLVENTRDEEDETFNYSVIHLMLSLNEQFMLAVHGMIDDEDNYLNHNTLIRVLSARIGTSKTFGENVIFMFNRAETTEYFYTNDLRVVIDVFIRELYDLPEESEAIYNLLSDLSGASTEHFKPVPQMTQKLVKTCLMSEYFEGIAPNKCINGVNIMPTLNSMMFETNGSTVTSNGNDVPAQGMLLHG
ncbi:2120_t:CDS:2, partial [Racocetra fulgida]